MAELETRFACNSSTVELNNKEVCRTCPKCGQPMQQDKVTGEWVCIHCN